MKYYQICIDGMDRVGKDGLWKELDFLCNHSLSINNRGLMSNMAYDIIYNRDNKYDLDSYKNVITIYLVADKEDWLVRFKSTKEKDLDIDQFDLHNKAFNSVENTFYENNLIVFTYNTSYNTPYMIAKDILKRLEELNNE